MNRGETDLNEELVTEQLVAYERYLSAGTQATEPGQHETQVPAEVEQRVERAKACLDALAALKGSWHPRDPEARLRVAFDVSRNSTTTRRRVGRYEVLDELGAGGFGIVYRAWDPVTEREVALKVPRPESLASPELQMRFEQEARAAAKLDHTHIVPVLEAGQADLLPYIASAYYDGQSLASWLKEHRQPISFRAAAELVRKLAEALAHAHARGVLHRDVKPSNVLLVRTSADTKAADLSSFSPRLMDFGLAKIAGAAGEMTQTGAVLGTIRYMAPEQAAGRTREIGPAADVYGLGTVLYELLTGKPPFAADTDLEVLRRIQTDEPTQVGHSRAHVPRDLEIIVQKCLEKEPAARYRSAQALADDLDRFLHDVPIAARPSTLVQRFRKWVRRKPQLAAFLGIAIAATVVVIALLAWSNEKLSAALRAAREYAYASDMRLAQESWDSSLVAEARVLLEKYVPAAGEPDLRRFEWHYLWNSMQEGTEVVARQPTPVWSMAIAPDQKTFATGDRSGVVRLWSLETPGPARELKGHAAGEIDIDVVAFTPDGRLLASASNDGTVRLWNVASGECVGILPTQAEWVGGMAISPDGRYLASGDSEGRVLLWDLPEGKLHGELYKQIGPVRWIVFHPLRSLLVSACEKGEVRIWDYLANQGPPEAPEGRTASPLDPNWRNAAFNVDGTRLWAIGGSNLLRWDFQANRDWKLIRKNYEVDRSMLAVALLSRRDWIVTAQDHDFNIALRNVTEPLQVERLLRGHTDHVRCLASLQPTDQLLSGSEDGTVRRWRLGLSDTSVSRVPVADEILAIDWSPANDAILLGFYNGQVAIVRDLENPRVTYLNSTLTHINAAVWSSDAQSVYTTDNTGRVQHLDVATGELRGEFRMPEEVHRMATTPANQGLVCGEEKDVVLVDPISGRERWRFHHPIHLSAIDFLNQDELLTSSSDGYVRCLDVSTGAVKRKTEKQRSDVGRFDVSADGRLLVTGSAEKTVRIFDAQTFAELHRFSHNAGVGQVHFIDEDRRILVDANHRVSILDPATGQIVLKLTQFFEDGPSRMNRASTVLAAPLGKSLMLWRVQTPKQP